MGNRVLTGSTYEVANGQPRRLSDKGQSTLESAVVFVLIILFFGGITKIWMWSNRQIVERQQRYNESRVIAGASSDTYKLQWPVYEPPDLKEEDVLIDTD